MKKLIFVMALIGVLIGSVLGGISLADSGGEPNYGSSLLNDMKEIKDVVYDIENKIRNLNVEEVKEQLRVILGNVSTFEAPEFREKLSIIAGQIYNIDREMGNITMETMSNEVEVVCNPAEMKAFTIGGDSYPEVRHVFITISASEVFPPAVEAEQLQVYGYVDIVPDFTHTLERLDLNPSNPGIVTYEFNATEWEILFHMKGNWDEYTVYNVQYAATITYPN